MLKTASPEVIWLAEARKHIGLKEIKRGKHHPEIVQFVAALCAAGWYIWGRFPRRDCPIPGHELLPG